MNDNSKLSNTDKKNEKTFTHQLNKWFGTRNRIWYFVSGVGLTILALWTLYIALVLPLFKEQYEDLMKKKDVQIDKLEAEKTSLMVNLDNTRDTLNQLRSIGYSFGIYKIPELKNGYSSDDYIPILGKWIMAIAEIGRTYAGLDIIIDTCPPTLRFSEKKEPCVELNDYIPLSAGTYSPFVLKDDIYYVLCKETNTDYALIELFKKID